MPLLGNSLRLVVYTQPLTPNSIIWYWLKGSDALQLGRWPYVCPHTTDFSVFSAYGLKAAYIPLLYLYCLGCITLKSIRCNLLLPLFCDLCVLFTIMNWAKTAKLTEVPSGIWHRVGPRRHILCGCPDLPREGAVWGYLRPIVKYGEYLAWAPVIR